MILDGISLSGSYNPFSRPIWALVLNPGGGHHDYGRDAFAKGPLRFPGADPVDGPFVFQAKFVQEANAAGAEVDGVILDAIRKEANRIRARQTKSSTPPRPPKQYGLLTNAPTDATLRSKIETILSNDLAGTQITVLGGTDICDRLDAHPNIRRAFPQLLGLRDLDELLSTVLTRESRECSRLAIEAARDLASVFVPTQSYDKRWEVLLKHRFVVLEGPPEIPEMGKTAIAWMVGLAQLANGWEVISCDSPEQIYERRDVSIRQIFISDDAFGRTEYDVSRGRRWENDLDRILRLIDAKHWLIWTSRKHILERALRSLDLQGKAAAFPKPAEVLVEASDLSTAEKALILYRHARTRNLESAAKQIVRSHAQTIINEPSFTPERIRRFVQETLPGLPDIPQTNDNLRRWQLQVQREKNILESIRHLTTRMRRAFQGLPPSHKWLLISLLEAGGLCPVHELDSLYQTHCPREFREPVEGLLDELSESFVEADTQTSWSLNGMTLAPQEMTFVDWIHPSYRDVIIDELTGETPLRERFLATMTLPGLKIAISDAGGAFGDRYLPLMADSSAWDLLADRAVAISRSSGPQAAIDLVDALKNAHDVATDDNVRGRLAKICGAVCASCVEACDTSNAVFTPQQIETFVSATLICSPMPRMPRLDDSWEAATGRLEETAQHPVSLFHYPGGSDALAAWLEMIRAINTSEPRALRQHLFPSAAVYQELIATVISCIDEGSRKDYSDLPSKPDMESLASDLRKYANGFRMVAALSSSDPMVETCERAADMSNQRADIWDRTASEAEEDETDTDDDGYESEANSGFDVAALFADL